MFDEAIEYVEANVMPDDQIRRLAIRVMANVHMAWIKYQEELANGKEDAVMRQEESLAENLLKHPLEKWKKWGKKNNIIQYE